MPHDHNGHHHHHIDPEAGDLRVAVAIAVNFILTLAQIAGGILSGSIALIADALHNLSDAFSLVIAFWARRVARRPPDADMTFGYARVEDVAALINYTALILVGFWLGTEAVLRFLDPQPVQGWIVVVLAGVALVIDAATAVLTYRMAKDSVNIRAAFLHNLADALGSVAVIIAGGAILMFGWTWIDPLVTLGIAGYILWMGLTEIRPVIRTLMLGRPEGLRIETVRDQVAKVNGVSDVHATHLWQAPDGPRFDAHVTITAGQWENADAIKAAVKSVLVDKFHIQTSVIEIECTHHKCTLPPDIGG